MAVFYSATGILILILSVILSIRGKSSRPNIVFIIADDMGWDDVSFHGSDQVQTPNMDMLAFTGVALSRHYGHCVCTPSRAALLSGKYAHTLGMQGYPLTNGEDRGMPLTQKLLPEYLKELGYSTHLIGKWHQGMSRTAFLPTSRGFDSHFGFRGGFIDYYEYINEETWSNGTVAGFDLHRNLTTAWDVEGYATHVFTNEAKSIIKSHDESTPLFLMLAHAAPHAGTDSAILQAPPSTVRSMRHVELVERRIYAAMMKELDDGIGDVVEALADKGILDNTIIVFISDNGGVPIGRSINYASNWPLRGLKFSPYEGGIRTTGVIWTSSLANANHLWTGYMHVVDWLPTLLKAAGAEPPAGTDGIDLWTNIITNEASNRSEFFEIYTYGDSSFSTIVCDDYKLVTGNITKDLSQYWGGNYRGIIGSAPSYTDTIANSKVYSIFKHLGIHFKMENIGLRDDIRVNCESEKFKESSCFTENNTMCLYNIQEDPCETRNLLELHPDIAETLLARLQSEMCRVIDRPYPLLRDPRALPRLHNYTWSTWADNI